MPSPLTRFISLCTLGFALFALPLALGASPPPNDPLVLPYTESAVHRLALSLGRETEILSAAEGKVIVDLLEKKKSVPASLADRWKTLLYLAQLQTYQQMSARFFPVGYEFEVYSPNREAYWEFEKGYKEYERLISRHFGLLGGYAMEPLTNGQQVWEDGRIIDSRERPWAITTEYLRKTDWFYPSGWEIGTPPFFVPEELQLLTGLLLDLSRSKYGKSNSMTSVHQTYSIIPPGTAADSKFVARVAANYLLIVEQHLPAIYELIDSIRGGGPENFFMMPLVLDHYEMLQKISAWDPAKLDLADLQRLMHDEYALKEFNIQLERQYPASAKEKNKQWMREQRLKLAEYDKKAHRENWKFRDTQIKFNLTEPTRTLIEDRKGDYKHRSIEKNLLQTFLNQAALDAAYKLAEKGQIWKLDLPTPKKNELFADYWKRLKASSSSSIQSYLGTIGISADPNKLALVTGAPFTIVNPRMKASARISFGFEIEGKQNGLVEAILPRDPSLRKDWRWLDYETKAKIMKKMGFRFDQPYSLDSYRVLTSEFYADFERFPFLDPELHQEASGNWEIKSNGRGFTQLAKISKGLREAMELIEDGLGIHTHSFFSEAELREAGILADGVVTENAKRLAAWLYDESFWTQIESYAAYGKWGNNHYLDSWSLDRLSPQDIARFLAWASGQANLDSLQLKFHNLGIRPVDGGLDIEFRDNDEDIDFALSGPEKIENKMRNRDFGPTKWGETPPLFMEFRDHPTLEGKERFTIEGALAGRYPLTDLERRIAHLLQFEISKPSMGSQVYFKDFSALEETPPELLDTAMVRTNFENNVAIPLLNYEEQPFVSLADMKKIDAARTRFLERVRALVHEIATKPKFRFMTKEKDFLHLCQYLERSTHPSRPDFSHRPSRVEAEMQRKTLEDLVFRLRSEVATFVEESTLKEIKKKLSVPGYSWPGTPLSQGYQPKKLSAPLKARCFDLSI